ncbi:MAG: DNA-primase RepB domain-containing protein [Burkholderiales bacterium]
MVNILTPDLNEAQRFLDILEPDGEFWFQTAEEPKPDDRRANAHVLHGTLSQVGAELVRLNRSGHAVWVQINEGTGRTIAEITRIRSYFVDQDKGHTELLLTSAVPCNIVIESSHGKYHGYWLTKNAPLGQFVDRMHALADKFQGDHSICNLNRVMRLPGFFHLKGTPFMTRIHSVLEGA